MVPIPSLCTPAPGLRDISYSWGSGSHTQFPGMECQFITEPTRPTGCSFPSWTPEARSPGQERDSELSKQQASGQGWPVPGAAPLQHLHCSPTPGISSTWVRTAARHPVSYDQILSSLIWSPKGWLWSQRVTRYTPVPFAFCQALCLLCLSLALLWQHRGSPLSHPSFRRSMPALHR